MSMEEMNSIIGRAASDTTFRTRFFEHFDAAISAYDLTAAERALLKRVTPDKFEAVFKKLEEWDQPASTASMELMQLIYGPQLQDDDRAVTGQWKLEREAPTVRKLGSKTSPAAVGGIPTRLLMVFAGVALIGVIIAMVLLMALGAARSDNQQPTDAPRIVSTGGPAECPCVCVEECTEGAVTCITVCTDCQEDRCVP